MFERIRYSKPRGQLAIERDGIHVQRAQRFGQLHTLGPVFTQSENAAATDAQSGGLRHPDSFHIFRIGVCGADGGKVTGGGFQIVVI